MDMFNKARDYAYMAAQVSKVLDDAPGGEKAWVPMRRALVVAILEHLQYAEGIELRIITARGVIDNLLRPADVAAVLDTNLLEPEPAVAESKTTELEPVQVSPPSREWWIGLSRAEKVATIRKAWAAGERLPGMPDRRTWKRHYPEAFYVTDISLALTV